MESAMRTWLNRWKRPMMGWLGLACIIVALIVEPGTIPGPPPATAAHTPATARADTANQHAPAVSAAAKSPARETPGTETPVTEPPATATTTTPVAPTSGESAISGYEIRMIVIALGIALICMALPPRTWSSFRTWWRTADDPG